VERLVSGVLFGLVLLVLLMCVLAVATWLVAPFFSIP
jgi:hypothetical protein